MSFPTLMPAPPPAPEVPPVDVPPVGLPPVELPPIEPPAEIPPELFEDPLEPPLPDVPLVAVPLLDGAVALSPQPAKPIVNANAHPREQRIRKWNEKPYLGAKVRVHPIHVDDREGEVALSVTLDGDCAAYGVTEPSQSTGSSSYATAAIMLSEEMSSNRKEKP
jgi:hypothetical protein